MSDDNSLNLRSRVVPRQVGNDQASSAGCTDDPPPMLPEAPETSGSSAPQELTLSQLFKQIARMLENAKRIQAFLERNNQAQEARLELVMRPQMRMWFGSGKRWPEMSDTMEGLPP